MQKFAPGYPPTTPDSETLYIVAICCLLLFCGLSFIVATFGPYNTQMAVQEKG